MSRVVGIIPARWASTRFPGKILAPLCGKPLVQWVWERVSQANELAAVCVATDDNRIADVVAGFGGKAVMTAADHPSGTDRIAEALAHQDADAAINIQGDEPLIEPALIDQLAREIRSEESWDMVTAAEPLSDPDLIQQASVVKVVCAQDGRALYFSRAPIPFVRDPDEKESGASPLHLRHIGIYAYRRTFLERLVQTPPTALEDAEKLEQLRALFIGGRMKVIVTHHRALGVDVPEDLELAAAALRASGLVREED